MRILLVEDDLMIADAIMIALEHEKYAVDWVKNGEQAIIASQTHEYFMILLDLCLPRKDGFSCINHFRSLPVLPGLLIISAMSGIESKIKSFNLGADDYLVKPFDMNELLVRIRAIQRRRQHSQMQHVLDNGVMQLDTLAKTVSYDGKVIKLTPKEFVLLNVLFSKPGKLFSKHELEEQLYSWGNEVESNVIEFIIHALRKKMSHAVIKNVRGLGWMISKQ